MDIKKETELSEIILDGIGEEFPQVPHFPMKYYIESKFHQLIMDLRKEAKRLIVINKNGGG